MNMRSKNANEAELRRSAQRALLWWDLRRSGQEIRMGLLIVFALALFLGMSQGIKGQWFLMAALTIGLSAGFEFGSCEWKKGHEEYAFGLPPTREDRYVVRFGLGLLYLAVMLLIGLAAGPFGWFSALGRALGLDSFEPESVGQLGTHFQGVGLYALCMGLGLALYVESFAISINIERGKQPNWMIELLPFGIGACLVVGADMTFFPGYSGFLTLALGVVWSAVRFQLGLRCFERKDIVLDMGGDVGAASCQMKKRNARVALLVAFVVAVIVAMLS